jgi:outer membrane protein insertion porin family
MFRRIFKADSLLLIGMLFLLLLIPLPATGAEKGAGEVLHYSQTVIEGLTSMERNELMYLMGLSGGNVKESDISEGIKRVFRKGLFDDISVWIEDSVLRIKVKERMLIGKIVIRGNDAIPEKKLLKRLPFHEREILRYDLFPKAKEALKKYYAFRGYPDAEINMEVKDGERPNMVRIDILISEGNPERIGMIDIEGYPDYLRANMKISAGDIYDQEAIEEEMVRLKDYFHKKGYHSPVIGPYTFEDGLLTIAVNPGMKLVVRFEGNASVGDDDLMEVIDFDSADKIDEEVVDENASRILRDFHRRGFARAQVAPVVRTADDVTEITFFIYEGKRYTVGDVKIRPAEGSLDNTLLEDLKGVLSLQKGGLYNPDFIQEDEARISDFLKALGFQKAVTEETGVEMKEESGDVNLLFLPRPGPRYTIGEIVIQGNTVMNTDTLIGILGLKEGDPFNYVDLFEGRRRILNRYRERGYLSADLRLRTDLLNGKVGIMIKVNEGSPSRIGKTVVRGNIDTKTEVILRELNYREGALADYRLFPELSKRLYETGLFSDVNIRMIEGEGEKRDVVIDVKERKPGIFEFGLGYSEYEKMRGFLSLSYRNLQGMNRRVTSMLRLSKLKQMLSVSYHEPYLMGKKIRMNALLSGSYREERSLDTKKTRYKVRKYLGEISVEKTLTKRLQGKLTCSYSIVNTFDVAPDVVLSKEDTGTIGISAIMPALLYDTRDDLFEPHKGILAGASLKIASRYLLGETDFVKLSIEGSLFRELTRNIVLALLVKTGLAEGFMDTTDLPIVERFFLGGRNAVRGFPQDELGPKGEDGTPTGGNASFMTSIELRTKVWKDLGLVFFFDAGNVWRRISDMDFNLRKTAGIGIRYSTPVGPLRLDYGHKLDRREGESAGEIHFSIGHAF